MSVILASPLARRLAREGGIKLTSITGSGPMGRITREDVLAALNSSKVSKQAEIIESRTPSASSTTPSETKRTRQVEGGQYEITPIRRAIARAMRNSWEQVAYVSLIFEANVTRLWDLRKRILSATENMTGAKLTFMPWIIRAYALALEEFPLFRAKLDPSGKVLNISAEINIGIAVDTPHGLMVPVIRHANQHSIVSLQQEVARLAARCRDRTITAAEMQGGVFTITNYGSVGAVAGTPVINYPELAIGGVGVIRDHVYIKDGEFVAGKLLPITIAADHQWIDGGLMGQFARRVIELLELPELLGVL